MIRSKLDLGDPIPTMVIAQFGGISHHLTNVASASGCVSQGVVGGGRHAKRDVEYPKCLEIL